MQDQRLANRIPWTSGVLGVTAGVLLIACGGGGEGGGAGGSGATMDLVEASNGFGQLLPHTVLKLGPNGQPTPTIIQIRKEADLIDNLTASNGVRPVQQYPAQAVLPSGAPGNHFLYVRFTQPIDIDTVLSSAPGAQANSGLLGSASLVSLDPATGQTSPIQARVFINGYTYAGSPVGNPPVLPLQRWVEEDAQTGQPKALVVDGGLPGLGFPGTEPGATFSGAENLISPNVLVFVVDSDGDLTTKDTFPSNRQIKLKVTNAVRSTGNKPLKNQALACTTVNADLLNPEVGTSPPPINAPYISPGGGIDNVDPETKIRIEFTEPVQPLTVGPMPAGAPPVTTSSVQIQFGDQAQIVTVPFTVLPVSVYDLSYYELTPSYNFPGNPPDGVACLDGSEDNFSNIDVFVNTGLIRDLVGNANVLAATTDFTTGQGPGLVNAPVVPDAIYIGRSGGVPGVSVIDLNGFGASTGLPNYDINDPIVEGNSNYPNNPNVRLQGGQLYPPLVPGQCPINGGSAGVFTLTVDSSLNDKVIRAPLVTSIDDMMIGHALDSTFNNGPAPFGCQSGGGNLCAFDGKKLIVPLVNGNTMNPNVGQTQPNVSIAPGAENLVCWAPHPNPPPLQFPPLCVSPLIGGQEPTSVNSVLIPPAGAGLTNLLAPGDPFGVPSLGVPPSGLLTPEQNTYFEGPSPPAAQIASCVVYSVRQQIGHFLYVIDRARREIVVFNSNRMTVIDRIPTQDPTTMAMSPNLNLIAVVNQLSDLVSFIDIDPSSSTFHEVVQESLVGDRPRGIAWDPGNEDILVCNEGDDTMSILSAASLSTRRIVSSQLSDPFDVAITPRQWCWGYNRYVYFGYILNRNGRLAIFESGPNTVNGWGYDDIIGIASVTLKQPKAIQPDHVDVRSAVWVAHEGPIDLETNQAGPDGIGAVSKLVVESASQGVLTLNTQSLFTPQFRDMFIGVQISIGTPQISGVPVDLAFDNQRNLAGLPNTVTPWTIGTPTPINGKSLVRGACFGSVVNTNEPRYMFVAVPNPVSGTGVVDVVRIDLGFARIDTNAFQPGIQSVPATNVQVVSDFFRQ